MKAFELSEDKLPWEKQKGETPKAFEAFAIYRDLGPSRSIREVAQKLYKSCTIIGRWSSQYKWVERVTAYDVELEQKQRIENEKVLKEMNERQARASMMMQNKMLQALNKMSIEGLKPNDIVRLIEIGMKYERIARGADALTQQSEEMTGQKTTFADLVIAAYKNRKDGDAGE